MAHRVNSSGRRNTLSMEVCGGTTQKLPVLAPGCDWDDHGECRSVSSPVAIRWFRHAEGMTPISLDEPLGRYLSFAEREEISFLRSKKPGCMRSRVNLTATRERFLASYGVMLLPAGASQSIELGCCASQWKAQQAAKRLKVAKLVTNLRLQDYVQKRLAGQLYQEDGTVMSGPKTPEWKGLNKPHRTDRKWSTAWSPEQISHRLELVFPDDKSMRISHEAIYQSLYVEGRGALKLELVVALRTQRPPRKPRARAHSKPHGHVTDEVVISKRPPEAAERAAPGHCEGDLIIGTGRSAIGTVVERSSRSILLVHLPRLQGWGNTPPTKKRAGTGWLRRRSHECGTAGFNDASAIATAQNADLWPRN